MLGIFGVCAGMLICSVGTFTKVFESADDRAIAVIGFSNIQQLIDEINTASGLHYLVYYGIGAAVMFGSIGLMAQFGGKRNGT